MASPSPTFIIVPGHWHTTAHLKPLITALSARSLPSKPLQLHTVGRKPASAPRPCFSDDVSVIYSAVAQELLAARDVCLVLHSYAGVPGAEAINCLIKDGVVAEAADQVAQEERRPDSGIAGTVVKKRRGKLVRVVFIAAMSFPAKVIIDPKSFVGKDNPGFTIDDDNMTHISSPWHFFFNDLPLSAAKPFVDAVGETYYVGRMQVMSENWRKANILALLCRKDNVMPPARQEAMWNWLDDETGHEGAYENAQWLEGENSLVDGRRAEKRKRVEWIEACHTPWVSRVDEVADYLARAVGRGDKR